MVSRDEILIVWNEAVANFGDNPTDAEIDAAAAVVCAKCGVTPDELRDALRAGMEVLKGEVASTGRVLRIVEAMVKEWEGKLPGLPVGPPLKH